jgi:cell division septum initiation protein DivIVA
MTPGLCLDSGEFIPADELNRRIDMTRITDRELQSLRNTGNVSEDAADDIIELRQRITELKAQIAHLTASLETASAACIVLKQQQREGWAQLASGQHLAQVTGFNVPVTFGGCPSCGRKDCAARACTRPAPTQQPLTLREIAAAIGSFADQEINIARAIEVAHGIKERP